MNQLMEEIRSCKMDFAKEWPARIGGTFRLSDAKQHLKTNQDIEALFLDGHYLELENTVVFLGAVVQDGSTKRVLLGGSRVLTAFASQTSDGKLVGTATTTSGVKLHVVALPVDKARSDFMIAGTKQHEIATVNVLLPATETVTTGSTPSRVKTLQDLQALETVNAGNPVPVWLTGADERPVAALFVGVESEDDRTVRVMIDEKATLPHGKPVRLRWEDQSQWKTFNISLADYEVTTASPKTSVGNLDQTAPGSTSGIQVPPGSSLSLVGNEKDETSRPADPTSTAPTSPAEKPVSATRLRHRAAKMAAQLRRRTDERLEMLAREFDLKFSSDTDWPSRVNGVIRLSDMSSQLQINQEIDALFLKGWPSGLEETLVFLGVRNQGSSRERILLGGPTALGDFLKSYSDGARKEDWVRTETGLGLRVYSLPVKGSTSAFVLPGRQQHVIASRITGRTKPLREKQRMTSPGRRVPEHVQTVRETSGPTDDKARTVTSDAKRVDSSHLTASQTATPPFSLPGKTKSSPLTSSSSAEMQDSKAPLSVGSDSLPSWKEWQNKENAQQSPKVTVTDAQGHTFEGVFAGVEEPAPGQAGTSIWVMLQRGAQIASTRHAPVSNPKFTGMQSHLLNLSTFKVALADTR
jgi:hypothetical protein